MSLLPSGVDPRRPGALGRHLELPRPSHHTRLGANPLLSACGPVGLAPALLPERRRDLFSGRSLSLPALLQNWAVLLTPNGPEQIRNCYLARTGEAITNKSPLSHGTSSGDPKGADLIEEPLYSRSLSPPLPGWSEFHLGPPSCSVWGASSWFLGTSEVNTFSSGPKAHNPWVTSTVN